MTDISTAHSADGTQLTIERAGSGPKLVLVDGALCSRTMGPGAGLAKLLSPHFTVFTYDRRGRGDSNNVADRGSYVVGRELDDLRAVVSAAGGDVALFGQSSGALLALDGAAMIPEVTAVAAYEAPLIADDSRAPVDSEFHRRLEELLDAGKHGPAVAHFLGFVGLPKPVLALMRLTPIWPKLKAMAPTLVHDSLITREHQQGRAPDPQRWAGVKQPALVLCGSKSATWMQHGSHALAEALPDATLQVLEGQSHNLRPKAVAPELIRFFQAAPRRQTLEAA